MSQVMSGPAAVLIAILTAFAAFLIGGVWFIWGWYGLIALGVLALIGWAALFVAYRRQQP